MFILCASNEEEYYALEELHNAIGIITEYPIYFIVEGYHKDIDSDNPKIYFTKSSLSTDFPQDMKISIKDNNLYIHTNILGWIVWALSRIEEADGPSDRWGRFAMEETLAYKQGILDTAYLDKLINEFKKHLVYYFNILKLDWQEVRPWDKPPICLTHDVDSIKGKSFFRYIFWITKAFYGIRITAIKKVIDKIKKYILLKEDPHFSFVDFCDLESKYGFKSTFFFLSLPFSLGREGRRYYINESKIKVIIKKLIINGWEVGLHPSRLTHLHYKKLKNEYLRLYNVIGDEKYNLGVRNHYLKAVFPETWEMQESMGFVYDSTLGWDSPGFRAGLARPFQPFDHKQNRKLDIWELPLIVMDSSLDCSEIEIQEICLKLSEESFKYGGCFTLLWHTDALSILDRPVHAKVYEKLLKHFSKQGHPGWTSQEIIKKYSNYTKKIAQYRSRVDGVDK